MHHGARLVRKLLPLDGVLVRTTLIGETGSWESFSSAEWGGPGRAVEACLMPSMRGVRQIWV